MLGSALETYRALDADAAAPLCATAVRVLFEKLQLLCELERSGEAADVKGELVVLLGDVTDAGIGGAGSGAVGCRSGRAPRRDPRERVLDAV